jgi:hypothetical protein
MAMLSRDPGSTSATAFNIGNLSQTHNYTNFLDDSDLVDIYQFSLDKTSEVSLLLETNSMDGFFIDLFIDKNSNSTVDNGESILPYTEYSNLGRDSTIDATLGVGTYSIRLYQYLLDRTVNYSLNLDATPALSSTSQDPGNNLSTALSLGHLNSNSGDRRITEFIGNLDPTDIYKFSIDEGKINLTLESLTGKELGGTIKVDLIKDKNHNQLIDSDEILDSQEIDIFSWSYSFDNLNFDNKTYDSGNYFLRFGVSEYDDHTNTNYSFELASQSNSDFSVTNTAIYRFFIPEKGAHFYTASPIERDYISKNIPQYQYEGSSYIAASEERDSLTGVKPVYRFFNTSTGVHLYTMSEHEKEYIVENLANYNFENVAYYAYETPKENTVPLYRFYHTIADTHFFTPSLEERNYVKENLPWYREEGDGGITFYVEPLDKV